MFTSAPLFAGLPGGMELAVILLIAVLLFGANKIPKLARSTGQAMGEFQKGRQEIEDELEDMKNPESPGNATADASTAEADASSTDTSTADADSTTDADSDSTDSGSSTSSDSGSSTSSDSDSSKKSE